MKIAFVVDHFLSRNFAFQTMESLLEYYPEADLFGLVYHPNHLLGPFNDHFIHATFLNGLVKNEKNLYLFQGLIPSALKSFKPQKKYDLVVCFSQGFAQGIELPIANKKICYYLGPCPIESQGFFSGYVKKWFAKSFQGCDEIYVPHHEVKNKLYELTLIRNIEVLAPGINSNDFYPIKMNSQNSGYYVCAKEDLSLNTIAELEDFFRQQKKKIIFVDKTSKTDRFSESSTTNATGSTDLYSDPYVEHWGERCDGELAPLLANAKAVLMLTKNKIPHLALLALASGRPYIALDSAINREFLKEKNGFFITEVDLVKMAQLLTHLDVVYQNFDPLVLRSNALKYSPTKFKNTFYGIINNSHAKFSADHLSLS
jgi:hypothetical protein